MRASRTFFQKCSYFEGNKAIGNFRGLNRYEVLNSVFKDNTATYLFTGFANYGNRLNTEAADHRKFDGNTFCGNTVTSLINVNNYGSITTVSNNIFDSNSLL